MRLDVRKKKRFLIATREQQDSGSLLTLFTFFFTFLIPPIVFVEYKTFFCKLYNLTSLPSFV